MRPAANSNRIYIKLATNDFSVKNICIKGVFSEVTYILIANPAICNG